LKDFEVLQKTDLEAALRQLELLEHACAEWVSLCHRSTDQSARNKVVRAKYNKKVNILV
jgi:U3 small nucleolar RNA-associated protein 14